MPAEHSGQWPPCGRTQFKQSEQRKYDDIDVWRGFARRLPRESRSISSRHSASIDQITTGRNQRFHFQSGQINLWRSETHSFHSKLVEQTPHQERSRPMNKKQKKQVEVEKKKLVTLQLQLTGAKTQLDDPREVERLQSEIDACRARILKAQTEE